jgi:hypothetical protein
MIMHYIALYTPCIALFNCGHLLHIWVDHVEPESEFQAEQVRWVFGSPQVSSGEDTNLALNQGKPLCIPPKSLSFIFETLFIKLFNCVLSLHDLYGTVVALGFSFPIILVYPCYNSCRLIELTRHRYKCRRCRVVERSCVGNRCLYTHCY